MNGTLILLTCYGAIVLYLVGLALISWIFTSIVTDGNPDDFDYAMTTVILQIFISIAVICDKVIGILS